MATRTVRGSIALPKRLVDEVAAAPAELRINWNQRQRAFAQAMARMADDPAIKKECAAIQREFARAEADGLAAGLA